MAVVGGGPSGLTVALLLARAGHRVTVYESGKELGGLWASDLDTDGFFLGENSCKVFQSSYRTAPALFRMLGTRWEAHFTPRHDLTRNWLAPFLADSSCSDLARLGSAYLLHSLGLRNYRDVSVKDFLERNRIGEACQAWMRATALGGITGTLRMTMWELFHRLGANLGAVFRRTDDALHWNAHPPNSPEGFVTLWQGELRRLGVGVRSGARVVSLTPEDAGVAVATAAGRKSRVDAAFLAVPPPALSRILLGSANGLAESFGKSRDELRTLLADSVYEHLGLAWTFDRDLPTDLPLGGHNVRRGWHPILVQHSQYRRHLRPPAVTAVTGSVSLDTDFLHERLGTRARDHAPEELARILWEDERRADPTLPEPIAHHVFGLSNATQIVSHGPLPIKSSTSNVFLASSLNGEAPYFTASLESAIQAGAAAAVAFDARVERLPMEPARGSFSNPRRSRADLDSAGEVRP